MPSTLRLRASVAALLAVFALSAQAEVFNAEAEQVTSGDSLTMKVNRDGEWETLKVKIRGIDAPEMNQDGGKKAEMALSALIQGRKLIAECEDIDANDNYLCSIATSSRLDVGLYLLERGLVWVSPRTISFMKRDWQNAYVSAELYARRKHKGLFSGGDHPIPPWEWRKTHPYVNPQTLKEMEVPELSASDNLAEAAAEGESPDEVEMERTQLHVQEPTTWYGKLFQLAETWCTEAWTTIKNGVKALF